MSNPISELRAKIRQFEDRQELMNRRLYSLMNGSSTNLGGNRILTETRSGLRIFIDGRDTGSGLEIIHSGYIEPDVMKVLQRAFKPGVTFLDVGANFGFYSLFAAQQMGSAGRVFAFEANPHLIPFIEGSVYINGLTDRITLINKAVAESEGVARFGFSFAHIGGGSLLAGNDEVDGREYRDVPLVPIDAVIPRETVVDVVKLDVEGHEASALRGMRDVVARSPDIQIVLEFFPAMQGQGGSEILALLEEFGLRYWKIGHRGKLTEMSRDQLVNGPDCYLVAARTKPDDTGLEIPPSAIRYSGAPGDLLTAAPGHVIVHGPYWYLPQGSYEVTIHGEIKGSLHAAATHEFGFEIASATLSESCKSFIVRTSVDLRYFEVVLRAIDEKSAANVQTIKIRDLE